jgi:8-oxo-dGTP pyrophosphatase MutT (NUDIX family)
MTDATGSPHRTSVIGNVRAMCAKRFTVAAAVYGVLLDAGQLLLLRRHGSGYHDGELSLPAGHLDGGEDAVAGLIRELAEELTIAIDRSACRLGLVIHRPPESPGDHEYLDLVFTVSRWTGTPSIGEPDKCSELVWADPGNLPGDTIDYIATALRTLHQGEPLLLYGWDL